MIRPVGIQPSKKVLSSGSCATQYYTVSLLLIQIPEWYSFLDNNYDVLLIQCLRV